jgi:uncharacterized protein YidB (DUF937 family)
MGMFDVLGGNRRSGGMSPIALAVLGTLAYKALKSKGGLGGMFGSQQGVGAGSAGAGSAATPDARAGMAPPGAPSTASKDPSAASDAASGTARGAVSGAASAAASGAAPDVPAGAAAGGLGGLLGGLGGGGLGSGLRDLLDRFRETGHEEQAKSWVSTGTNRPIAASEMEQVLGAERVEWLMQQTGLSKDQLLAGLSRELPNTIDKLTPKGQLPTDDELDNEIRH